MVIIIIFLNSFLWNLQFRIYRFEILRQGLVLKHIYVHKIEICIPNKICDKILKICKIKLLLTWNNLENALLNIGNPKGIVV